MLTPPTRTDLATFTGRDVTTYTAFADQALAQATLLFATITRLDEYPADPQLAQLARNAIMEMADRIYLMQPYQGQLASPFVSESIGSYSYSKLITQLKSNLPTGLFWWDLAIETLLGEARSLVGSGSVHALDRDPHILAHDEDMRDLVVFGPADIRWPDMPYDVNADSGPHDPGFDTRGYGR